MRTVSRVFLPLIAILTLLEGTCHAQGRTYHLLRTDSNLVRAGSVEGIVAFDGWHFMSDRPVDTDDTVAHEAISNLRSDGDARAEVLSAAMAVLTTPFNETSWSANATVNVYTTVSAIADQQNTSVVAEAIGHALADGDFKVLDFESPDPNKQPVLNGALYILVVPTALGPGKDMVWTETLHQNPASFSVTAGHSYLNGEYGYPGDTWHVTGTLKSLGNPGIAVDEFWPRSINRMILFAHEASVGGTYNVETDLDFGSRASAIYDHPNIPASNSGIYWASLATWFYVDEWELNATDPYEGEYITDPVGADFPPGIQVVDPEDNPDIPDEPEE